MGQLVNNIIWRDIVCINGKYYAETAPVEFCGDAVELNNIYLGASEEEILSKLTNVSEECFDVGMFIEHVAKKYGCKYDDVQTFDFDDFNISREILDELPFGAESCGAWINGISV